MVLAEEPEEHLEELCLDAGLGEAEYNKFKDRLRGFAAKKQAAAAALGRRRQGARERVQERSESASAASGSTPGASEQA